MNEQLMLNSDLIRAHLDREHRKCSWLVKKLCVSSSTVNRMLVKGQVPHAETLKDLADLLGVEVSDLLIPKRAA